MEQQHEDGDTDNEVAITDNSIENAAETSTNENRDSTVHINQGGAIYQTYISSQQDVRREDADNSSGWLGGISLQYRAFTFRVTGLSATVLSVGALGLSYESLKLMGQILEVIASLATQVVFKVQSGSLPVHVLASGSGAKQLLEDLTSNRLLRTLQDISKEEDTPIKRINLINVGAVIATEEEFHLLKKRAKKRLKRFQNPPLQVSINEENVTVSTSMQHENRDAGSSHKIDLDNVKCPISRCYFSLLQNKTRILSQEIPPEDEQQIIECLKRNQEFSLRRGDQVDASQGASVTSEGFLSRHQSFVEFLQTAQLHPSLQLDVYSQLKSIKQSIWTSSTKSSVVEVEDLIILLTPHFTGDCERVLRDVVKIGTALFLRSQSNVAFRLFHWALDLFNNIGDPATQIRFLKTCCIAMDNALYLTKGDRKTVLFYFLLVSEIRRRVLGLKETHDFCSFSLLWLEMYFESSLYSFLSQQVSDKKTDFINQSVFAKLQFIEALLSLKNLHKSATFQCKKLAALPILSTAVPKLLVEKTLAIAETLETKSKFVPCLKLIGWSLKLIDRLLLPFHGRRNVRNADYKLEKLKVCSGIICRVGCILLDDLDMEELVDSWICPLLHDVNQRISCLACRDATKKEELRLIVSVEFAHFSHRVGQYKKAENALLSLAKSLLCDHEYVPSLSLASCFYHLAVTKQSLCDFKNALQLCKVARLFYMLPDDSSKDDCQKVINVAEKLLFDQSNKEELQRVVEIAENLLSEKFSEVEGQKELDSLENSSEESGHQVLIDAAENLELQLLSLVDKSNLS